MNRQRADPSMNDTSTESMNSTDKAMMKRNTRINIPLLAEETNIKTDIFEIFKSAGKELTSPASQVAMKKLWFSCRRSMASSSGAATTPGAPPQNDLPDETKIDYAFVLPESWRLSATLQLKLWKGAMNAAASIEAVLMEHLRLLSQKARGTGSLLSLTPGCPIVPAT